MNAPLPRAQLTAFRAAIQPAPGQPRATFVVRRRSMMTFDVVRTLSGASITPIEAAPYVCCAPSSEREAEAFAARAAVRFSQKNSGALAIIEPFPKLGRRPGQAYSAPLPPEPDDEHRLGAADCLDRASMALMWAQRQP